MGEYLNPGCEDFQMAINSEVFVDKTEILGFLNTLIATEQRHVCISRPRRFGKTMTAKMLCAYYGNGEGARELFQARKVAQLTNWDSHLGKYNVIRLVMTEFIKTGVPVSEALAKMQRRVLTELASEYPDVKYDSEDFRYSLSRFRQNSRKRYVVIIDEWDVIFRAHPGDGDGQKMYLEYLRDWLKDNGDVALAYMTGILPVKKYGAHSALNMFTEYSMTSPKQMAQYTGFTTQEVKSLCQEFGRDYSSIADWYDGYVVNDIIPGRQTQSQKYHLFSPLSVVNAIITGQIRNYWNSTETYEALAEYIRKDFDDLKQAVTLLMDGGRVRIDIGGYQNDMTTFECRDDILTLLVHLGYLGYDEETSEVFIPNQEVLAEFRLSTRTSEWVEVLESFRKSQKLLQATWDRNESMVAELLEEFHDHASNQTYHNEAALSYAIRLAYYSAQRYYTEIVELDSGKGYVDLVYLPSSHYPDKPALLIELKYARDADTALAQMIHRKRYPARLAHYRGNLLLIAINYDQGTPNSAPDFKHHTCIIEQA